jgi:cyclopropane-fatty-acyl-phospholipid synthase
VRLQPGQTVVEAGCGWGGLARHMASRYGVKVRAFNISREQIAYARQRAAAEGLGNRVEFIEDDYRQITGQYDVFMSVGMLEHVGANYYNELGRVIDRSLVQGGRGLIHTIGRHRPMVFSRWIESRIFPGADPPTLRQMMDIFEPHNMAVLDVENLRLHYARTLHHWLERYERAAEAIGQMFDEEFVRAWRLYLAGSQAAFTTGFLQLYQVTFARYNDNDLPATRAALYRE